MLVFILIILLIIVVAEKFYRHYYRHSYLNFEQFKQSYCPAFSYSHVSNANIPVAVVDMFTKCDNNHKFHAPTNADYFWLRNYIEDFLCHSSEYVNRQGPVCPFVPRSLKQQSLYFFMSSADENSSRQQLVEMVRRCRYDFLHQLEPINRVKEKLVYKSLILVMSSPGISHSLIDQVQTLLKPEFVLQHDLMLGEFYDTSNSCAKRNEHFYPLRTKVPLLVIRYLVADDIDFLDQAHKYPVNIRLDMVKKYIQLYHLGLLYRSKPNHLQMANEILEKLNAFIQQ